MLHLLLFRHAKSSWADPRLDDHDRPLNERGERDASRMGEFIGTLDLRLELILCSTANRARETLRLALPGAISKGVPAIRFERGLYEVEENVIRRRLERIPDATSSVLVVGHNPGMHKLALRLMSGDPNSASLPFVAKYPTSALSVLASSRSNWKRATWDRWRLETFMTPKHLQAPG
ncbi:MAG: SixA phosphatase family protein [Hyphomicrobiaceae bacterium]